MKQLSKEQIEALAAFNKVLEKPVLISISVLEKQENSKKSSTLDTMTV
jgi:hypothetical protein